MMPCSPASCWRIRSRIFAPLNYCGEATCVPNAELAADKHKCFEFLYIMSGSASWDVGRERVQQDLGDLFVAHANENARQPPSRCPPCTTSGSASSSTSSVPRAARSARMLRQSGVHVLRKCHEVEFILRSIVSALATPLPDQRRVILAYLNVFLIVIQQRLKMLAQPDGTARRTFLPYSYQVQTTLSYMERNLHRNVSLSELARVANMRHVSNFCFQFRREVGATPAAHHLRSRLDAARDACSSPPATSPPSRSPTVSIPTSISPPRFRRAFGTTPLK